MTSVIGEVVERRADAVVVDVEPSRCASCRQACRPSADRIALPFVTSERVASDRVAPDRLAPDRIEISMTAGNLGLVAMNTLGLPLAGFVVGAVLADVLVGNDIGALSGSLIGFVSGFLACRAGTLDKVVIREAVRE